MICYFFRRYSCTSARFCFVLFCFCWEQANLVNGRQQRHLHDGTEHSREKTSLLPNKPDALYFETTVHLPPPVSKLRTKSVKLGGDTRLATPPAHARALPSTVPDARPDDLGP